MDTDTNERSRSSVLGMRVISISEGLELGRIRQAVVTQEPRVAGFTVRGKRSRNDRWLAFTAVSSFGEDRITVESQKLLSRGDGFAMPAPRRRGPLSLVGSRAFTSGGRVLGRVEEYGFSTEDGSIIALEISNGPLRERLRLPGRFIIAISPQTVMLKEEALDEARPAESTLRFGINAAAGAVSGAAGSLAGTTLHGAKKLTANLVRLREKGQAENAENPPASDEAKEKAAECTEEAAGATAVIAEKEETADAQSEEEQARSPLPSPASHDQGPILQKTSPDP